jgi:PAS domain S-box-containing protein
MKNYEGLNVTLVKNLRRKIDELKQSEAKYRTILENTNDIIYSFLPDGTIDYISSRVSIFGYAPEEVIGHKIIEFIHPDDRKYVLAEMQKTFKTGKDSPTVCSIVKKDGTLIWIEEMSKTLKDNGCIIKVNGVIRDITERKQAEEKIIENENKFKAIFESDRNGILVADAETKKFLSTNPAMCKMLGYTEKELLQFDISKIHPKQDLPYVTEQFKKQLDGKIDIARNLPVLRKDNTVFYADINSVPMRLNGKDVLVGFFIDITEQKQDESKIKESEEKYRALINTTDTGYVILDGKGIVLDANQEYVRLTGHKGLSEIKGRSVMGWTAKYDFERNIQEVKKCFKKGFVRDLDVDYVDKNGKITPIEVNATVIDSKQGKIIVTLCRNITERKKAEEKIKENEELLHAIFDGISDGLIVADVQSSKFVYANTQICRITGYTEKELLSLSVNSLHSKKDLPYVLKQFGRMAKGELSVVKGIPVQRKDKTIVHCDISARIINVNGRRCMAGIFRDTSKEKIADDKIKESEEKYRILYETSSDAIMTLEPPKWDFTSGNPATVKMFKAKNEKEFTSKGPRELSPKYQLDGELSSVKAKKMIMKAMKTGSNFFEWTHKRINGKDFPATVLLTRVTIGGKTFLQATVRDLTQTR